jgi:hypothetical protein
VEADVLVTDPPYGIGWRQHGGGVVGKTRGSRRHHGIAGDHDTTLRDAVLEGWTGPAVVFGSFRAPFPPGTRQVLVYRKSADAGLIGSVTGFRTDVEPIFLLGPWPKRDVRWSAVVSSSVGLQRLQAGDSHPHAKPLDVMTKLLRACPPGVVLDPFMGSGSTLRAAKDIGRKAVGIEVEERYCEIAARRMCQEVLDLGRSGMSADQSKRSHPTCPKCGSGRTETVSGTGWFICWACEQVSKWASVKAA